MKDSIHNVEGEAAREKIKEIGQSIRTCLMLTSLHQRPIPSRPMAIQEIDDEGFIYFFSRKDSEKVNELRHSDEMQLVFVNEGSSEYMTLHGKAEIFRDQQVIDKLYSIFANTWFEGKEDPNLTIIRFSPLEGNYWDTKHGKVVQLAGIFLGALTGKQTDDGVSGKITL